MKPSRLFILALSAAFLLGSGFSANAVLLKDSFSLLFSDSLNLTSPYDSSSGIEDNILDSNNLLNTEDLIDVSNTDPLLGVDNNLLISLAEFDNGYTVPLNQERSDEAASIPEPESLLLFASGIAGFVIYRKKLFFR